MTDYGHELEFGTFTTPANEAPEAVVRLAEAAEELGLDLVSYQDHPYQSRFLDTWTLLSYVAARTNRVKLAPNVVNLPLRPPAVLARAAASLDLLSGGRVELGLGAGAFWDPIEAMGGARLSPGESVDALQEAIAVLRALWDTEARGGARLEGEHYRLRGAARGPAPAHRIGLWIGAYKPRMLALTGRLGDGWIPTVSYLAEPDLAAGNAAIDEAAAAAGRDPREVRRLLNLTGAYADGAEGPLAGPPQRQVEELARLALEQGISGFFLVGDDPRGAAGLRRRGGAGGARAGRRRARAAGPGCRGRGGRGGRGAAVRARAGRPRDRPARRRGRPPPRPSRRPSPSTSASASPRPPTTAAASPRRSGTSRPGRTAPPPAPRSSTRPRARRWAST